MHRAEKASSKLCREREVEKAQELHRRKIGDVKSYLTAITRPPIPVEPPTKKTSQTTTFFRRSQRQHVVVAQPPPSIQSQSVGVVDAQPQPSPLSSDDGSEGAEDGDGDGDDWSASGCSENDPSSPDGEEHSVPVVSNIFGKLDELRSVLVPVMAYKGDKSSHTNELNYERLLDQITLPTNGSQSHSSGSLSSQGTTHHTSYPVRASAFRMRRLKQIESDNATLFGRIKSSTAHYKAEHFKKDWDRNVAYLTSICEFPVIDEMKHASPPAIRQPPQTGRKRSPFTARPPDQLPSLQHIVAPVIHPIKAIPTSPRKPRLLNLSPAFRSLRKGLPQAPSLPPLATSPRTALSIKSSTKSSTAIAGSRASLHVTTGDQPSSPARSPSHSPPRTTDDTESFKDDSSRYTLLKVGRFIGGKYLVLTVFCGDGITNPYGFDVVALDPETHVAFHLSISKETTHCLLDTISSSSMVEQTAAAAGTNLSMELIASCICDHVRYASLGSSELVFLIATVGNRGGLSGDTATVTLASRDEQLHPGSHHAVGDDVSLLLATPHAALSLCFHQLVSIPVDSEDESVRQVHVFASTRPQQCCHASMNPSTVLDGGNSSTEYTGLVCFEVRDAEQDTVASQLHMSVGELFRLVSEFEWVAGVRESLLRLSLDRVLMLSLRFLHFDPLGYNSQLVLKPSQCNSWICGSSGSVSPSHSPRHPQSMALPPSPTAHLKSKSGASFVSPHTVRGDQEVKCVLQTGVLWRGAFLFVRVALICPTRMDAATGVTIRDPLDELLVVNVFNSSTGSYSERVLDGDRVELLSGALGAWQSQPTATHNSETAAPPLVAFTKLLLLRLRLDVDLRGHEVIVFPTLELRGTHASRDCLSPTHHRSVTKPPTTLVELASLDSQPQRTAVVMIQALVRGFLAREDYHKQVATRKEVPRYRYSAFLESLPPRQHEFVEKRAAKCIQLACREFADRSARRKNAYADEDGIVLKVPRSSTPTLLISQRGAKTPELEDLHESVDGQCGESDDGEEGEDEDDARALTRHVDVLGILEESQHEEEGGSPTHSVMPRVSETVSRQAVYRTGTKVSGRFVLIRQCLTTDEPLESRAIGAAGAFSTQIEQNGA